MVRAIYFLLFLLLLCSCVGTLESKKPITTQTIKTSSTSLAFTGITAAQPISDSKVDVFFNAASGNPADLKYLVYVNDAKNPIEVSGNKITPSLARPGEYKVTVEGLRVNTNYSFSVGLKDSKTGQVSNSNKSVSAQTYMNLMANFNGILSAKPLPGNQGTTKVELKWIPATITGGILGAAAEDPIAYRIQVIAADLGEPYELLTETNPNIVTYIVDATDAAPIKTSTSPKLLKNLKKSVNGTSSVVISDLLPDTKYYFLVRAIHTDYIDYRLLLGYEYEHNLNIVQATTLNTSAQVGWAETSVVASTATDDFTLTKKNLNWLPATGPFKSYRVYAVDLGTTNNLTTAPDVTAIDNALNNGTAIPAGSIGLIINASTPYKQLTDLVPYHYYNVIVSTCLTDLCNSLDSKISSPLVNFQVLPTIAPFFGLVKIENPNSSSTLNKIYLQFDAPVTTAGFLTDLEVYCLPTATSDPLTQSLLLDTGIFSALAGPSQNCQGLKRNTITPGNFANFTSIEIEAHATKPFLLPGMEVSGLQYCFAVVPVIKNGGTVVYRDKANMVTKCSFIQKKMPSIIEFPGAKKLCSEVNSNSLTVSWEKPTSGIYNGYTVIWKKNDGAPFLFSAALSSPSTVSNPVMPFTVADGKYYRQDILNPNTTSFLIQGLQTGSRYIYGVLAHDKQGANFNFSEINTNINDCSIALPVAKFDEWIEIFAVGPKENGFNSLGSNGYRSNFITETLNDYGQPVEVDVDASGSLTSAFTDQFGTMSGTTFNGAYGMIDNNPSKGKKMLSNQGIVRIAWKDIGFTGSSATLNDSILTYDKVVNSVTVTKPNRKYGYHVYRSNDNQQTWVKLTGDAAYQTPENMGLLHPSAYYEWKRSNAGYLSGASNATTAKFDGSGTNKFNAVVFTDYSVSAAMPGNATHTVERARVYYYKVVPVVNGVEMKLAPGPAGSAVPQNIIKVVLPPPNMSYVSRLIANRQTCLELNRTPSKDVSTYYTCSYDGIGSKTLGGPSILNDTPFVFDVGKDFLIDRFELGCNYTRGSTDPNSSQLTNTELVDFNGSADSGAFEGCYFEQKDIEYQYGYNAPISTITVNSGLGKDSAAPASYTNNRQLRKGDCVSASAKSIKEGFYQWMINYPGLNGTIYNSSSTLEDFFTVYSDDTTTYSGFAAQSEYAAVHFNNIRPVNTYWHPADVELQGKNGTAANKIRVKRKMRGESECTINLPSQMSNGKIKPRWIPVNSLSSLQWVDGDGVAPATPVNFSIITKTMAEIKDSTLPDNYLYDETETKLPVTNKDPANPLRFNAQTKLGRVISSNSAKLPPIIGLDQKTGQELCSTYEVQVGFESGGVWTGLNNKANKRLFRRQEAIIAGAWPGYFKEGAPNRTVDGFGKVSAIVPETGYPVINPAPALADKIPPLVDVVKLEQGRIDVQTNSATPTVTLPKDQFNGSCNSSERGNFPAMTGIDLVPGAIMKNYILMANANNQISYILSGSSYFDNDSATAPLSDYNTNTQVCTSKYGVQDLVGNASEISGEKIFCDKDAVVSGASIGLFNDGATTEADPHVDATGKWYRTDLVTAKGYIADSSYATRIGSCSVVNSGSDRSIGAKSRLFTDGSSIFNTLLDLWGNFTNLVDSAFRNTEDPKNIEQLRSGDGFFLDFGENALGASLEQGDELALYNNPNTSNVSQFFSPIIGLPLKCPDVVCGTPLTPPVSDNKKISTQTLNTSGLSLDVANFPIGNSQFSSDGVLSVEDRDVYHFNFGVSQYPITDINAVVSIVRPPLGGPDTQVTQQYFTATDGTFDVANPEWSTDYSYPMRFINGGSVWETGSGRYGGSLRGDDLYREHERRSATRCAITLE